MKLKIKIIGLFVFVSLSVLAVESLEIKNIPKEEIKSKKAEVKINGKHVEINDISDNMHTEYGRENLSNDIGVLKIKILELDTQIKQANKIDIRRQLA